MPESQLDARFRQIDTAPCHDIEPTTRTISEVLVLKLEAQRDIWRRAVDAGQQRSIPSPLCPLPGTHRTEQCRPELVLVGIAERAAPRQQAARLRTKFARTPSPILPLGPAA